MRKFYSLILFLSFVSVIYAQPWLKNLPQHKSRQSLTFFDYQDAFEAYWAPFHLEKAYYDENGVKKKATGWKQFKRWEYMMESQINPLTGEFPKQTSQQVYDEFVLSRPQQRSSTEGNWTSLGPDNSNSGYSGVGRINCIAFHPTDNNTYWIGAAAGGLWVTTDDGSSWTCLTDNNGVLAVSNIVIPPDYASSHTIFIATGDRDSWDNRSIGVLKSTDSGNTWKPTGLSFSIFDAQMVNRLLMEPTNNEILIAATTIGVFKTLNGGADWSLQLTPIEFIDMEFQPGNPNTIYGSTKNGRIFVSTDGSTFGAPSFEDQQASRVELAVSPNQPAWVYAVAANHDSGLYGIYKSENSGATFSQVFDGNSKNLLTWDATGNDTGGQGYYDLCLAASPSDANTVLVGGVNTWGSADGGTSWTIVNHWVGDMAQEVHADKHYLSYRDNGDVFECNDGGVYVSHDNGSTWTDKTNGIVISQMYKLGVSQTDAGDIITGLQDNGTKIHSGNIWFDQIGGDGMECLIDYTDKNIQYGTLYYGQMYRTMDHWQSSWDVTPFNAGDGAWITPYVIDPVNPGTLYAGYTEVYQSLDRGDVWFPISFFGSGETFRSMAIAPSDNQVLYVANYSRIWKTVDAGGEWNEITSNLPTSDGSIRYISVKHDDPNTLWVALSGYANPGVYESRDGGITWRNISAGLPPIPASTVVENKLFSSQIHLFAGTELGVYYKKGDNEWTRFSNGLPNVIISELEIYYAPDPKDSRLRAATYGRGLWETPVPFSLTPVSTPSDLSVCSGSSVSLDLLEFEGDIQWQSSDDGLTGWTNVSDGTGANSPNYITGELYSTIHYRAIVSNPGTDTLYSNITSISVLSVPDAAGPVTGDTSACRGDNDILYMTEPIANASTYVWTLPNGVSGSSITESITVDFGVASQSGIVSVAGKNSICVGTSSELAIQVSSKPSKPSVALIVQPTCEVNTGEVTLVNLPSTGEWTLTEYFDGGTITGTGSSTTITGLESGTYAYIVTNQAGCTSVRSSNIIIYVHASTPATPVITVFGDLLQSDASDGNQWYDDNGLIPDATDQEYLVTVSGNYYTIVTLDGCSSLPSNVVKIDLTGITDVVPQKMIKVYPNPVEDELVIEIPGNNKIINFAILNALGQLVHTGEVIEKTFVNTTAFPAGVFILKTADGGMVDFKKVVKE